MPRGDNKDEFRDRSSRFNNQRIHALLGYLTHVEIKVNILKIIE